MLSTKSHPVFQTPIDNQIDGITIDPNKLLKDLLESDQPLFAIAGTHKLSIPQLLVWCDQPAVRALLDEMDDLALRRASHKAAQSRHAAIQVLTEQTVSLCETSRDREQANRAARAILRYRIDGVDPAPIPRVSKRIAELQSELSSRAPIQPPTSKKHPSTSRKSPRNPHPALNALRFPVYRFILRPESHDPSLPYQVIEVQGNGHHQNGDSHDDGHAPTPSD